MKHSVSLLTVLLASLINIGALSTSVAADPYPVEYTQGNIFSYTSAGTTNITPSVGIYYSFTATENSSVTSISLNTNGAGNATSLTFGLKASDVDGKPTGAFLTSGAITTGSGWNTMSVPTYSLTAGQVYHVVVMPTVSGSVPLRHLSGIPSPASQPYGIVDSYFYRGAINASGHPSGAPSSTTAGVYAVGTTTRSYGQPYSAAASTAISNTAPLAQRFQFTPNNSNETKLESFTLRLVAGAAPKDIIISLLDDNNIVLATTTLAASIMTTATAQNYEVSFLDAPILTEGSYYNLAIHSAAAGSTATWFGTTSSTTDATINSATFQGVNGYAFNYSNTSFAAELNQNYGKDYYFSYTTAIPEPAAIASTLIGLGCIIAFRRKIGR